MAFKGHKGHHHGRKEGGKVEPAIHPKGYNHDEPNVEEEADEKKKGGRVGRKKGGHVEGHAAKHRLDRPGRKRGGRAGAEMAPLTEASKIKDAEGHKATEGNAEEGP